MTIIPPPRRDCHVKSDNTHTIIKIHPLAHIIDTWALFFSSCSIFTVYPNSIMLWHPSPLQVITTIAQEGGPKEHSAKQKWPRETHSVTYVPGLSTLSDLPCIVAQPPPSNKHLFILNSIHSQQSNQTSQIIQLNNIHFPSLSTSHTPCLCSLQCRWYNYSFI